MPWLLKRRDKGWGVQNRDTGDWTAHHPMTAGNAKRQFKLLSGLYHAENGGALFNSCQRELRGEGLFGCGDAEPPQRPGPDATRAEIESYNAAFEKERAERMHAHSRANPIKPPTAAEIAAKDAANEEWAEMRRQEAAQSAEQKRAARLAARDKYDAEHGRTGFRRLVDGLVNIGDAAVQLPFVPKVVQAAYSQLGPRAMGYEGGAKRCPRPKK